MMGTKKERGQTGPDQHWALSPQDWIVTEKIPDSLLALVSEISDRSCDFLG